jgi:adenylate cyclase
MTTEDVKRKLTAIFSADVQGYSRLMGDDEGATVQTITAYRKVMIDLIQGHHGRVVDAKGDNVLAEFPSVVDAIHCADKIQKELKVKNAGLPEHRRMAFRIGVNLGDVIEKEDIIYGDGVNIAARLESLAEGGGICISGTAFDQIGKKVPLGYEYLGKRRVKNIEKPIRVYKVLVEPEAVGKVIGEKSRLKVWHWTAIFGLAVLILVTGVLGFWEFYVRPDVAPASLEKIALTLPEKPSIAVLPFDNLSGDPKQEYFSDGMTDDLITDLSKVSGIFVIARNSTFAYKGESVPIRQIAEELGVRYMLEGSVRKADDNVRINAQLIDATTGYHLWGERYDGKLGDVFDLQDRITRKIVAALAVKLTSDEREKITRKETDSIEAYDAFTRGQEYLFRLTPDDFAKALQFFEKAIEFDRNYARAYAALAMTYLKGSYFGWERSLGVSWWEARKRARQYLEMSMNNPTSLSHSVASEMNLIQRLYKEAIAEAERAIALDPNAALGHITMANALIFAGRPEEAVDFVKKAMRHDPRLQGVYLYYLGLAHFCMGQLEETVTLIERALKHNPEIQFEYLLTSAYAHLGRDQDAKAALAKAIPGLTNLPPKVRQLILRRLMLSIMPFKDPEIADRFANGLIKAGFTEQPFRCYKIYEENRLTGDEIRALVFGRTVTGFAGHSKKQFWITRAKDGKATLRGGVSGGSWEGTSWLEGDKLCNQWPERHGGRKICFPVFRNPEDSPEKKDEYMGKLDFGISLFSPVD